jgi:hypothetical protein
VMVNSSGVGLNFDQTVDHLQREEKRAIKKSRVAKTPESVRGSLARATKVREILDNLKSGKIKGRVTVQMLAHPEEIIEDEEEDEDSDYEEDEE